MGIYDREYYRGESGGPGWFGGVAPWCKTLIVINCAVFLVQQAFPRSGFIMDGLEACPEEIFRHGRIWQLWTATFLHADLFHLIGNMWFLWLVGREMEAMYGSRDFLAFYLVSGGISTLGWATLQVASGDASVGLGHPAHMVGASGAVMAVVTLYTLYYPRREILFFFFPMPMWVLLAIYLVLPLTYQRGLVAYEAHLIGAGVAYLFKRFDLRWSRLVVGRFRRPRLKVFTPTLPDPARPRPGAPIRGSSEGLGARPSSVAVIPEEQLDAQLDEVLAKIAREGRGSLTDEEQRVLQEASRRARIKRSDRP